MESQEQTRQQPPPYLRLVRGCDDGAGLRDADGRPLPASPRPGMIFEVCWGHEYDDFETWRISRVNSRSFYYQTWSRPLERCLIREWDAWLQERMEEGELRWIEDAPPPRLRCLSGGLDGLPRAVERSGG